MESLRGLTGYLIPVDSHAFAI